MPNIFLVVDDKCMELFARKQNTWEQRKLTDISKTFIGLVTTMTTNYREAGTLLIRNSDIRDNKFIFSEKPIYLDSEFAKSNESRKLKSGDVVTVHTGDIGTSAVVEEDIEGAIGFATINTRPDINYLDPHFLSTYFNTERHKKYAISVATGDGRSNYNIKDFNKLMLYMPSINEQKAIAEFIKRITDLITLHQRKLNKLEKLKKAYLEELFPDGNQCKPKRRFKEFKDDWEQRKLTDISKTFIGLVTTMTTNYREAGTLLIRNSDIRDNKFIFSEKPIYLDSEFAKSNESRKLKSGDVVTVHTGDIGTSAVVEEDIEGAIGFATINTRPDINYLDPHFLSTYFNTERHKKYAISVATGDGRSNYNIKDFNKLMLYMPSINEQKAIAEFIKRITDLITLHQRKLQKLKKLKAAYLDELFV